MEDGHPGLGLDVKHPNRTHPRLDSMKDFPKLHPLTGISQVRPTNSRMQVKQAIHTTKTDHKLNNKQPDIKKVENKNNAAEGLPSRR